MTSTTVAGVVERVQPYVPPPCHAPVGVVFEDPAFIVVDKPAGLLSVPGRVVKDCVVNRLMPDYPTLRVVHRLDLDTSGLMVFALTRESTSHFGREFQQRRITKHYDAVVYGRPDPLAGDIELPIAHDPDRRPRQRIDHEHGKWALTRYQVTGDEGGHSRVELIPETGRSHQLRLHLAAIGHPILGCDLYAHDAAFKARSRLHLHATRLAFRHPVTLADVSFEIDVPF